MKRIDNYKIIRVHKYTSVVFAVLLECEDSIFPNEPGRGDHEVRDFFFEVLTRAEQELKLKFPDRYFDLNDNKIAFEIEWQGATIYVGHRDLKYMIGCSVRHHGARVLDMETGMNSEYLVDR